MLVTAACRGVLSRRSLGEDGSFSEDRSVVLRQNRGIQCFPINQPSDLAQLISGLCLLAFNFFSFPRSPRERRLLTLCGVLNKGEALPIKLS